MHAIRLHAFGPPENLVLDELPDLEPGPGEVRVAVEASGVHLLDTTIRRGEPGPLPPPELPTVPGREVAGVVDAVGPDADRTWLGQRVVAHLGPVPGGYAEQAVTAADKLFRVADHVSFPDAVAAVGTGRTALGVVELEPPAADDVVLVPSAAGGLGWLLVQSALAAGATVVAAARGERTEALAGLGAHVVVDYAEPGWDEKVRADTGGVSLVYDGVGGEVGATVSGAAEAGRSAGHVRLLGGDPDPADHRRPDQSRDQRRLVAGRPDGGAARRHPWAGRPGAGQGGVRRVAAARLDVPAVRGGAGRTATSRAAGRSARSCSAGSPMNSVEVVGPHRQTRHRRRTRMSETSADRAGSCRAR